MKTNPNKYFLWGVLSLTLVIILLNIVGYLSLTPYPGFLIAQDGPSVAKVFDHDQRYVLLPGDQIISINGILVSDYQDSLILQYWRRISPGDSVAIVIERDDQRNTVNWKFSGQTKSEFRYRFFSPMWVALIMWGCGAVAYLTIEPKDHQSELFIYLCCLLAIWLGVHFGPTEHHLWYGAVQERVSAWMLVPLLISFTWQFPKPLRGKLIGKGKLPLVISGYLLATVFLVNDLRNPSEKCYLDGLLIGVVSGIALIVFRYLSDTETTKKLKNIYISSTIGYLILTSTLVIELKNIHLQPLWEGFIFLGLLPFPLSILHAIWSRKISKYRFRASQYLAGMIFSLIVLIGLMMLVTVIESLALPPNNTISVLIAFIITAVTTQTYPHFSRFVDWYIFKIPVYSKDLLQNFSKQMDSTKDTASLSTLIGDMILPSLMVRQSVLMEVQSNSKIRVLDYRGVIQSQIPDFDQVQNLLDLDLKVIPPQLIRQYQKEHRWIRVVLPLVFDNQLIGIWLLGQRDPNDQYDGYVVDLLQALAQQTTIALINHRRSQRLRTLYKANIDRDEEERAKVARYLHDDTLNDLALLQRETKDPILSEGIERVIRSLRKAIRGLRPEMLSYGLETALYDLGDTLNERLSETIVIVKLDGVPIPIEQKVEQHLYRIVQQACENSLRHAQASKIQIIGIITEKAIHLTVVDDGSGFNVESTLDFSELIAKQHYGIAGMQERADLINANLSIESAPGDGTRISIYWNNPKFN